MEPLYKSGLSPLNSILSLLSLLLSPGVSTFNKNDFDFIKEWLEYSISTVFLNSKILKIIFFLHYFN